MEVHININWMSPLSFSGAILNLIQFLDDFFKVNNIAQDGTLRFTSGLFCFPMSHK